MKLLGVLLCYNDADILRDVIEHLAQNNHDIVAWNHGSTDETASVLAEYSEALVENRFIPRDFDFYELYPAMSRHLMTEYTRHYDWISWPDDDEILEGPRRDRSYCDYLAEIVESEYDWIRFDNFNFWVTEEDSPRVESPTERVRRYCLFPNCAPRVRSWRSSVTNIREFNHNPLPGTPSPAVFRLRHYPARTYAQLYRRVFMDRANMQRGPQNYHYNGLLENLSRVLMPASSLLFDDGVSELSCNAVFDWMSIYSPGSTETSAGTGGWASAAPEPRLGVREVSVEGLDDFVTTIGRLISDGNTVGAVSLYNENRIRFASAPLIEQFDSVISRLRGDEAALGPTPTVDK